MTLTDEQRLAVATHEAAHAVIGTLFGAQVRRAEIVRGGPRTNPGAVTGFCHYDTFDFAAEAHRREVIAAGTIAEAVFHHGPSPTERQIDALLATNPDDRNELRRAYFASGGRQPMVPTAEVLPLVLRCWEPIAHLTLRLDSHGEIRHTDVLAALSIPAGSSEDAVALRAASIRSGSRPVKTTVAAV